MFRQERDRTILKGIVTIYLLYAIVLSFFSIGISADNLIYRINAESQVSGSVIVQDEAYNIVEPNAASVSQMSMQYENIAQPLRSERNSNLNMGGATGISYVADYLCLFEAALACAMAILGTITLRIISNIHKKDGKKAVCRFMYSY